MRRPCVRAASNSRSTYRRGQPRRSHSAERQIALADAAGAVQADDAAGPIRAHRSAKWCAMMASASALDLRIDQDLVERAVRVKDFCASRRAGHRCRPAEQEAENAVAQLDEPGQAAGAGRAARVVHGLQDLGPEQRALIGEDRARLPALGIGPADQVQDQIDARPLPGDVLLAGRRTECRTCDPVPGPDRSGRPAVRAMTARTAWRGSAARERRRVRGWL